MKIENLDKAYAFWGLAIDGQLESHMDGAPLIYASKAGAQKWAGPVEKPVRVYLIVEDDE